LEANVNFQEEGGGGVFDCLVEVCIEVCALKFFWKKGFGKSCHHGRLCFIHTCEGHWDGMR